MPLGTPFFMRIKQIITIQGTMKHKLFTLILLGLSLPIFAQQPEMCERKIKEESKTVFHPHWYLQVNAGASYTVGEARFGKLISPAMNISAGYQFTPLWGLRAGISGWEAKGAWANPETIYKYNYLQGNIDATLDLSNLFCGYNHKRFFNGYLFAGLGINGGFNNDEAAALHDAGHQMAYLWRDSKVNIAGRAGLGANMRITNRLYFNLEANFNVLSDKYNSKKAGNADWQFNALAGFTIKLGKTTRKTEPVYYPVEQVCPTPQPKEEKPTIKEEPTEVVQKIEALKVDIFFHINSSEIQLSEKNKISSLVGYLQNHQEASVKVCGYADRKTGNSSINEKVSKRRAEAVRRVLIEAGITTGRIDIDFKGDTIQPFDANEKNRVCICIAQ